MSQTSADEIPPQSEARLRRALRQMRRSGRRLVRWQDGWRVMNNGAVVAELTAEEGAFLTAEHHVIEAEGGGMVLAASQVTEEDAAPDAPAGGAWVFQVAGARLSKGKGRGFDRLARRAMEGEGPLTLRHIAAGLRLIADAESAMRLPGMTMDWSGLPADKRRSWRGIGGLSPSARSASRRIEKIHAALGAEAFDLVWALCVLHRPIPKLAADLGTTMRLLNRRWPEMFDVLAGVYDGHVDPHLSSP